MPDLTMGVTELVIEARDLDASERFYREVLGLPVVGRWEGDAFRGREAVWLHSGDRTRIGLWTPQIGIAGSRGGVHVHFAMRVAEADYDSVVARIRSHGEHVDEVYFGDDPTAPGQRSAYMTDPDGHVVELWTRDVATQVAAGPPHAAGPPSSASTAGRGPGGAHLATRHDARDPRAWERGRVSSPDRPWTNTTHDWRRDVDHDHLARVRRAAPVYAAGGVGHLVLEVVAYAVDEAESLGRRGACLVQLRPDDSVLIADDGRGTDTRVDATGRPVRKPIMATRDLRFFDSPDPPTLGDGLPRRGISVVAALSTWLVHTNRRADGAWTQTYRDGHPDEHLTTIVADGTTGTTVHFLTCEAARAIADVTVSDLAAGLSTAHEWLDVVVDDLRPNGGRDGRGG